MKVVIWASPLKYFCQMLTKVAPLIAIFDIAHIEMLKQDEEA